MVKNVAIIGCGAIAGGYDEAQDGKTSLSHMGAYRRDARFRVTACVDPDETRGHAFADYWGIDNWYPSLESLVSAGNVIDMVSVCTPDDDHVSTLHGVLSLQPKSVLAEKPLGINTAAAHTVVNAYQQAGTLLAVNYMRRCSPALQRLARQIQSGHYGELQNAVVRYTKGLFHNGSHMLDLMLWFFGELRVCFIRSKAIHDFSKKDPTIDAVLETQDSAPVYLCGLDSRHFTAFEVDLSFTEGRVVATDLVTRITRYEIDQSATFANQHLLVQTDTEACDVQMWVPLMIDNVIRSAAGEVPLWSDGGNAIKVLELCEVIRDLWIDTAQVEK